MFRIFFDACLIFAIAVGAAKLSENVNNLRGIIIFMTYNIIAVLAIVQISKFKNQIIDESEPSDQIE